MVNGFEYVVEISWPHVLGGINTKPRHTPVYELIQVGDNPLSHPPNITLQVSQTNQPTVANLNGVAVILHSTRTHEDHCIRRI